MLGHYTSSHRVRSYHGLKESLHGLSWVNVVRATAFYIIEVAVTDRLNRCMDIYQACSWDWGGERERDNITGSLLFSSPFDKELSNLKLTTSKVSSAECTKHNSCESKRGGVVQLKGWMCWQLFEVAHQSEIRNNIKDLAVMSVCLHEGSALWQQKQTSFWFVN